MLRPAPASRQYVEIQSRRNTGDFTPRSSPGCPGRPESRSAGSGWPRLLRPRTIAARTGSEPAVPIARPLGPHVARELRTPPACGRRSVPCPCHSRRCVRPLDARHPPASTVSLISSAVCPARNCLGRRHVRSGAGVRPAAAANDQSRRATTRRLFGGVPTFRDRSGPLDKYRTRAVQAEADSFPALAVAKPLLTCFLARYMAVSALLISSSPVAPSTG